MDPGSFIGSLAVISGRDLMKRTTRDHIRTNVIGYIALFLVLTGGTAYALDGSNTVFSDDIVNGAVKTADIGTGQVGSLDVKNGGIFAADLAPNAVRGPQVLDGSLTGDDIDESTLQGLVHGAVVHTHAVTDNTVGAKSPGGTATCGANEVAVGGGINLQPFSATDSVVSSVPSFAGSTATDGQTPNGWSAVIHTSTSGSVTATVFAVCAQR
jgi:hypothetical protein